MIRARIPCLVVLLVLGSAPARAQGPPAEPLAPLQAAMATAERALADDEREVAESHYRRALYAGWMLLGAVATADGRFTDARDAFTHASTAVVESGEALQSLAMVHLQLNDPAAALPLLTRLTAAHPKEPALRRLLAQALIAARQPAEAVQALEEAHGTTPDDLETTFALASGYLRMKKPDAARPLLAQLAAARPRAETYVLIGRAYRDAGMFADARTALKRALTMNPRVRHANYYLGTAAVMEEGVVRLDEAIAAFRRELAMTPGDAAANRMLSMALVEAHQEREALPILEAAARAPGADAITFQYLGRAQLATGGAKSAIASLRTARTSSGVISGFGFARAKMIGRLDICAIISRVTAPATESPTKTSAPTSASARERAGVSRMKRALYGSMSPSRPA